MCLVAGARARGGWRVVLDDARGAAGSLLKGLGRRRSHGRARMLCCAFQLSRSCVAEKTTSTLYAFARRLCKTLRNGWTHGTIADGEHTT